MRLLTTIATLALAALPNSLALNANYTPVNATFSTLTFAGPFTPPVFTTGPLNPALASFSIETGFFTDYLGNASAPNELTQRLLRNLAARSPVPPQVRIGGITADSTYWNASQVQALVNQFDSSGQISNTTLGPAFWDAVKLLPHGTKIIMNLDLQDLVYEDALSVAQATWSALGPGQVIAFEIGNEPDHYRHFTPQNYTAVWEPWTKNISDALNISKPVFQIAATADDPLWPYNAPGASTQLDCASVLAAGANEHKTVESCSEHTYQYSTCDPVRTAVATLPNLVNHTRLAMYLDLWQPRIHSVREQLGPDSFVIGEYNSVSCSGKDGVSNTYGQALWLLDTTLYAASINVSRLFIHQGGPLAQSPDQLNHGGLSFYDLWYPIDTKSGPVQVFPSYSAYLFIAELLGPRGSSKRFKIANVYPGRQANGSSITTEMGDASAGQLAAYTLFNEREQVERLALLNLQSHNATLNGTAPARPSVEVDISAFIRKGSKAPARVKRLTAPGADVKTANLTTWAGQEFSSGLAEGNVVEETVNDGRVSVGASEAVLVFL